MEEALLLIQKIKAMYHTKTFSKSDDSIAEYILNDPSCLTGATANSLAEASGTSPATVIRFCRKLGYTGFTELKNSAANYIVETARDMSLRRGDDAGTVKNKVISYTKMIMDELGDILDNDALAEAARLISEAKSLVIVSEGGSGTISRAAYDIFLKLRQRARHKDRRDRRTRKFAPFQISRRGDHHQRFQQRLLQRHLRSPRVRARNHFYPAPHHRADPFRGADKQEPRDRNVHRAKTSAPEMNTPKS